MKAELKAKWVAALRSGDYKQGVGALRRLSDDNKSLCYCCLGVLCEVARLPHLSDGYECNGEVISAYAPDAFFHDFSEQQALTSLNDNDGKSFTEIADWIETNIPAEGDAA